MDSQYKLLSELLSDQAAFITSPKTSLANYWGALPPGVYGPVKHTIPISYCISLRLIIRKVIFQLLNPNDFSLSNE